MNMKLNKVGWRTIGLLLFLALVTTTGAHGGDKKRFDFVLKDANGRLIGPFDFSSRVVFLRSPDGRVVPAGLNNTQFLETGDSFGAAFFYTSTDCSGPRLFPVQAGLFPRELALIEGILFYEPASGTAMTVNSEDFFPTTASFCSFFTGSVFIPSEDRCCLTPATPGFPFVVTGGPPPTLDISRFVPPFHVDIAR